MSELGLVNRCGVPDTGHDGTVDTAAKFASVHGKPGKLWVWV